MNKRARTQLKAYFLMVNLVLAVVAFSWLVGGSSLITKGGGSYLDKGSEIDYVELTDEISNKVPDELWKKYDVLTSTPMNSQISLSHTYNTKEGINFILKNSEGKQNIVSRLDGVKLSNAFDIDISKATTAHMINSLDELKFSDVLNINPGDTLKGQHILKSVNQLADKTIEVKIQGIDEKIIELKGNPGEKLSTQLKVQEGAGKGLAAGIKGYFGKNLLTNLLTAAGIGGLGAIVGGFLGGNGATAGFLAGFGGTTAYQIAKAAGGKMFNIFKPGIFGLAVGATIFLFMYEKTSTELVEFNCLPYQPPIGGGDCELCNKIQGGCSEYRCKSLGQACELLNAGTEDEKCTWVNPRDVNSPILKIGELLSGYKWEPDTTIRPPATGVVISQEDGSCVEPFTALEFELLTSEPAQCKIDYNLTHSFDEMSYYIGGNNLFSYNHTEEMSLPGPDAINAIAPEMKNDGTYTLYARCQDANGNFNQDAFSIRFCVKKGPDTTPPRIESVNVPSNSPINYNKTSLNLEVYVNEPSECKWSRTDTSFDNMEETMSCSTNLWEMNQNMVYTCATTLTGIKDKTENLYYFKCKDQPNKVEGDRNVNTQSYLYKLIGTQPLNILSFGPNETIKGSTDTIPVYLKVKTDNGYNNGEAICSYYNDVNNNAPANDEDYLDFRDTGGNTHEQRQDLDSGTYKYYYKCVDLGGNAAYDSTVFNVEIDKQGPIAVRAYKESGQLKLITNEKAECSYSNKDCNFEISEGIQMTSLDNIAHNSEWKTTKNYYIRCKDEYDNQPGLNPDAVGCSIIVRPYEIVGSSNVLEL